MKVSRLLILTFFLSTTVLSAREENTNNINVASITNDPFFWVSSGSSLVFSYFLSNKLEQEIRNRLPTYAGYVAIVGTSISSFFSRRVDPQVIGVTLPAIGLATLFLVKSVMICPKTGHSGCTCGLN